MSEVKFQGSVSGDGFGYVYVMSYPGSTKVKIGHSLSPNIRAADIGGTLAPEEPVVEAYFWCSERRGDVESAAHKLEKDNRSKGEWFNISVSQALAAIRRGAEVAEVDILLVYDRDDLDRKAANEIEAERLAQLHLDEVEKNEKVQNARAADALARKCMGCNLPLTSFIRREGYWVICRHCGYSQILRD